jgi:hypothetical protein
MSRRSDRADGGRFDQFAACLPLERATPRVVGGGERALFAVFSHATRDCVTDSDRNWRNPNKTGRLRDCARNPFLGTISLN